MKNHLILVFSFIFVYISYGQIITHNEINKHEPETAHSWEIEKEIKINKQLSHKLVFRFTKRGHGSMLFARHQWIRIKDSHSDGNTYQNWLLGMNLADVNGDGYNDIIIKGIEDLWHEKDEIIIASNPIVAILLYQNDRQEFSLFHHSDNVRLRNTIDEEGAYRYITLSKTVKAYKKRNGIAASIMLDRRENEEYIYRIGKHHKTHFTTTDWLKLDQNNQVWKLNPKNDQWLKE